MCLLTLTTPYGTPDYVNLYNASISNGDGFGFAIVADDELLVVRSMEIDWILDKYEQAVRSYPESPSLFHLRLATHGLVDTSNCHPFYVGKDKHTVMAHNGILPIDVPKNDPRSDTRIYAEERLPNYGMRPFTSRKTRHKLRKAIGSYNKIAMLTTDQSVDKQWVIINEGAGHWVDDTWYSNDSYDLRSRRFLSAFKFGRYSWDDEDDVIVGESTGSVSEAEIVFEKCYTCGQYLTDEEVNFYGYCETCGSCTYCYESSANCLCYKQPEHSRPLAITSGAGTYWTGDTRVGAW